MRCTRPDGSVVWQKQPKHGAHFALHDLTHFAVETTFQYNRGFYGLLAEGWDFDDVTGNGNPHSATCIAHERPYSELAKDPRRRTTARYNFITPDLCHDMHDSCAPTFNQIKQGDSWLAHAVPPILNSRAYQTGGVLFIAWDEAEHGDGPIPLSVLSPFAKGHGYRGNVPYTHSSLLRTLEEIFGVSPLLGDAAHASSLRDLFTSYP